MKKHLITMFILWLPVLQVYANDKASLPSSLAVVTWLDGEGILEWSEGQAEGLLADQFQLIGQELGISITLSHFPPGRMSAEFKKGRVYDVALYSVNAAGTAQEKHWGGEELYRGALVGRQRILNINTGLIAIKGGRCDPAVSMSMVGAKIGILRAPQEIKQIAKETFQINEELLFYSSNKSGLGQLIARRLDCIVSYTAILNLYEAKNHKDQLFIRRLYPAGALVMAVSAKKHGEAATQILKALEAAVIVVRENSLPALISEYKLKEHVF